MPSSDRPLHLARWAGGLLAAAALAIALGVADADSRPASVRVAAATGAAVVNNSLAGEAILRSDALAPGRSVSGTVTIANGGDATGAFTLAESDVLDTPGPGGGRLSSALVLEVDDLGSGRQIYSGPVGAMGTSALGDLQAGEQRSYRFTVSLPSAAADNSLPGGRVAVTFDWNATSDGPEPPSGGGTTDPGSPPTSPGPAPRPPDVTAPRVTVSAPRSQDRDGRNVWVRITCNERCFLRGLSRDAKAKPLRRFLAGVPTRQTIRLSRDDTRALWKRERRHGHGTVALALTVSDRAGNRTTSGFAVRVKR